ncbi:MAG TPA: hypothetical protein VHA56_20740 [Mucilaginibacter sp.]|nr:hypothetical protein [Mucilaginibacter sp.]
MQTHSSFNTISIQLELKQALYDQCVNYVNSRMDAAIVAIGEAQRASNDDTKSSAGDKYETGREMMQQEANRNQLQLNEANKLKTALNKINPAVVAAKAGVGSVVLTDNGSFYIAVGAGVITIGDEKYVAISPASPIGLKILGLKTGEGFILNEKKYQIRQIF